MGKRLCSAKINRPDRDRHITNIVKYDLVASTFSCTLYSTGVAGNKNAS